MAATRDVVKFVAPEFDSLPDATIDMAIEFAVQRVSARAFGSLYQQATAYLAAHILATRDGIAAESGITGGITSVRTGDLAVSGGALTTGTTEEAAIGSTSYGARFLELRAQLPIRPYRPTN